MEVWLMLMRKNPVGRIDDRSFAQHFNCATRHWPDSERNLERGYASDLNYNALLTEGTETGTADRHSIQYPAEG